MPTTHLSRLVVQALAVVALAVAPVDQALAIGVTAHTAAAVTGACVGAHHALWVAAQVFALPVGEAALLLVLAGLSEPVLITLTLPTVTGAMTIAGLAVICCAHPVVALTPRSVELPRVSDLTYADATVTLPPPATDQAIWSPTASL